MYSQKNRGLKRLLCATGYSFKGLISAVRYESAFRQEALLFLAAIVVAFAIDFSAWQRIALLGSLLLLLILELINSAIECAIDRISLEHHPLSGRAKDYGSAAVFLGMCFAFAVWGWTFISHFKLF